MTAVDFWLPKSLLNSLSIDSLFLVLNPSQSAADCANITILSEASYPNVFFSIIHSRAVSVDYLCMSNFFLVRVIYLFSKTLEIRNCQYAILIPPPTMQSLSSFD